jgi:hypothetical protein
VGLSRTIEFDIAFSEVSGFPGIAFRAATARWTYDRWMHVKLVVSGTSAELDVDGDSAVQVIPRLSGPEGAGEVGVLAGAGAVRFANFVVRPASAPSHPHSKLLSVQAADTANK